jgi:hypothetical protein
MYKLNLPDFPYAVKKDDGKVWIFDTIRKKYLVLTPEEWVRQHFVNYLITTLQYPKSLIRVEGGLSYNQLSKRSDIVVFDREAQPWMVVECKSPQLPITESVLRQASVYNATLKGKYIVVTNGLKHFCALIDWKENKTELLSELPPYVSGAGD